MSSHPPVFIPGQDQHCRWRLVVCDLDGTLVTNTTALAHLSAALDHDAAIDDVERKLAKSQVTDQQVADLYARAYRGLAQADAIAAMADISSLADIAFGVSMLAERSVQTAIATVSWSFAARALAELWGFTDVCGVELEVVEEHFTGNVARHFAPEDKVSFVAEVCDREGYDMDQVVAIGDGRSDLPLFAAAGFSVALNATSDARKAADTVVDGPSLLPALHAVPGLLRHA